MTPEYAEDLLDYLARISPKTILVMGADVRDVVQAHRSTHPACASTPVTDPTDCPPGRYDLALVSATLENLDKNTARALIARLRDQLSRRLLVVVPIGLEQEEQASIWSRSDFIALGMHLLGSYRRNGKPLHVYEFAIEDYKPAPEWLNSRHWANPELFDKYWW